MSFFTISLLYYCLVIETYLKPNTNYYMSSCRFKYMFVAYSASITGWKYCRPLIVVDGTFLKGKYKGTLFVACAKDGNNGIFPLAFGVGDWENNLSWEWFMSRLKETFGNRNEVLCIVFEKH